MANARSSPSASASLSIPPTAPLSKNFFPLPTAPSIPTNTSPPPSPTVPPTNLSLKEIFHTFNFQLSTFRALYSNKHVTAAVPHRSALYSNKHVTAAVPH